MDRSGDQIEIAFGAQRAIVATVAQPCAALHRRGPPLAGQLRTADEGLPRRARPGPHAVPTASPRGATSSPVAGINCRSTSRKRGHAIHGLVRWVEWLVEHRDTDVARFRHRLCSRPGYRSSSISSVSIDCRHRASPFTFGA